MLGSLALGYRLQFSDHGADAIHETKNRLSDIHHFKIYGYKR